MASKVVTASIDSDETSGTWTDPIKPDFRNIEQYGRLNLSIAGTWSGTVTLKRKLPGMSSYEDVDTHTANIQRTIVEIEPGTEYIAGMENGDWSSGTAEVRLSR